MCNESCVGVNPTLQTILLHTNNDWTSFLLYGKVEAHNAQKVPNQVCCQSDMQWYGKGERVHVSLVFVVIGFDYKCHST